MYIRQELCYTGNITYSLTPAERDRTIKAQQFLTGRIPAVLYGEHAERLWLFLHGQMGHNLRSWTAESIGSIRRSSERFCKHGKIPTLEQALRTICRHQNAVLGLAGGSGWSGFGKIHREQDGFFRFASSSVLGGRVMVWFPVPGLVSPVIRRPFLWSSRYSFWTSSQVTFSAGLSPRWGLIFRWM